MSYKNKDENRPSAKTTEKPISALRRFLRPPPPLLLFFFFLGEEEEGEVERGNISLS
jgi:hypothetical protein